MSLINTLGTLHYQFNDFEKRFNEFNCRSQAQLKSSILYPLIEVVTTETIEKKYVMVLADRKWIFRDSLEATVMAQYFLF